MTNPNDFGIPSGVGAGMEGTVGVAGLLPMVGGIYDTYQRSRDVKTQIRARKEEAELAYQRQVAMWHMQNAYNTPEQQMARFGAAGLNPHLIYGRGSSGDAGTPPAYQPPDIQTQGLSPAYGGAVASALPTLMSVGTWMQNMRLSENKIQEGNQLVEFLKSRYPHEIRAFDQAEKMWPYQRSSVRFGAERSHAEMAALLEEFRFRYGGDLQPVHGDYAPIGDYQPGGARRQEFAKMLQDRFLNVERTRLTGSQATWFEPATIMKLVLGGAMALLPFGRVAGALAGRGLSTAKRLARTHKAGKRRSDTWTEDSRGYWKQTSRTDWDE